MTSLSSLPTQAKVVYTVAFNNSLAAGFDEQHAEAAAWTAVGQRWWRDNAGGWHDNMPATSAQETVRKREPRRK